MLLKASVKALMYSVTANRNTIMFNKNLIKLKGGNKNEI